MPYHPLFAHFRQAKDLKHLLPEFLQAFPNWLSLKVQTQPHLPQTEEDYLNSGLTGEHHEIQTVAQLATLAGELYGIDDLVLSPDLAFCSGFLTAESRIFQLDYMPIDAEMVTESEQEPRQYLKDHEAHLKQCLIQLIEACGAELSYLTWTDTKHHTASESLNPFRVSERMAQVLNTSATLLPALFESEVAEYLWFLALKRDVFESEFDAHRQELESRFKLQLAAKTEQVIVLESKFRQEPKWYTPLYKIYQSVGLVSGQQ